MVKQTIAYFNSGFFDTDVTVIKELAKAYTTHWFVVLSEFEIFKEEYFYSHIEGSNVKLHLYKFNCRKRSFEFCKLMFNVAKDIQKVSPSVIFTCHVDLYFPIAKYLLLRNVPILQGIHDVKRHSGLKVGLFLRLANTLTHRQATAFAQFSKNQYELFRKLNPTRKTFLLGMSCKDYGHPHILKADEKTIRLLFFGTLQSYKGYDILIDAFEYAISQGVKNIVLSFYGKQANDEIKSICSQKIKSSVFYNLHFGFVDDKDVPDIFASHDFAVFPYRDATQSGPLMINVNYGLPIIAPSHTCFTDIYTHSQDSLLYSDSNSVKSLADVIIDLSKMSQVQIMHLKENACMLRESYTEESIGKNYINAINQIIHEQTFKK